MKVKCINNSNGWEWRLTIDKIYDVICEDKVYYTIINDSGNNHWYWKTNFKSLTEIRDEIIDKLLSDVVIE